VQELGHVVLSTLQLFLELFESACEQRESAVVHWKHVISVREESRAAQSSSLRSHGESVTNRHHQNVRVPELVDEGHVSEHIGVTSVVNTGIQMGNMQYETCRRTTVCDITTGAHAAARMISGSHGDLGPAVVNSASLVHLFGLILSKAGVFQEV